jgi:hypothetical protein
LNDGVRQPHPLARVRAIGYSTGQQIQFSGLLMAALIAIGVFIAAIFLLNLIEFGRLD